MSITDAFDIAWKVALFPAGDRDGQEPWADVPQRGMSGKSVEFRRSLTYGDRDWPTCGKGRHRLSPDGVQEGQEVDPGQPPVQVRNPGDPTDQQCQNRKRVRPPAPSPRSRPPIVGQCDTRSTAAVLAMVR